MTGHLQLCAVDVDERTLDDVRRTVLEAIDKVGPITARQAGAIVYRFRGFTSLVSVPQWWVASAGRRVLEGLENDGLVRRARRGRWHRCAARSSDSIGPSVARAVVARSGQEALETARAAVPVHPADIPANRGFLGRLRGAVRAAAARLDRRLARDELVASELLEEGRQLHRHHGRRGYDGGRTA